MTLFKYKYKIVSEFRNGTYVYFIHRYSLFGILEHRAGAGGWYKELVSGGYMYEYIYLSVADAKEALKYLIIKGGISLKNSRKYEANCNAAPKPVKVPPW